MTSKKVFYVLMSLLALIVIGSIAGTVLGTGLLKKSGDSLMERKLEDAVLEKDAEALIRAKRDIEQYKELDQVAKAIVPQEKDQARTVLEIHTIASQAGVVIENISFPQSELGQPPVKGKKKSALPEGATQLTEVEGLKGVFAMPIDITVSKDAPITYNQLLDFLQRLEKNRRTSHVTNITIQPDDEDRSRVHLSLQINTYIKP